MGGITSRWNVKRTGKTVVVDLNRASDASAADTDAIVAATENLLRDRVVTIVQVAWPRLGRRRSYELLSVTRALDHLAERYGKRMIISPV